MPASGGRRDVITARLADTSPTRLRVAVESHGQVEFLEYTSDQPAWPSPPVTLDFAAIALAQHASAAGADLRLEGPVTSIQLDRLDEYLQMWSVWRPDRFNHVAITAAEEVAEPEADDRASSIMGFSGGVDGCFALAAHHSDLVGRLSQPIGLGVLVLGWDIRPGDDLGAQRARAGVAQQLAAYDAERMVVETNWRLFSPAWFLSFNAGLTSILHTFSDRYRGAVHATDHNYRDEMSMPPYGSLMSINHLLGRPKFPLTSTGGTHRRIDRVAFLADHPALVEHLRVCYQDGASGENCGHCEKCVRTQLELGIMGLSTDPAFPRKMSICDLETSKVTNASVLQHYDDILAELPEGHEYIVPIRRWMRRERLEIARRLKGPLARIDDLETELRKTKAELADARQQLAAAADEPRRRLLPRRSRD